ncbi:hypothetical protein [Glycomyces buryatensis]|uniref:Uncharacterized protein n=1 Tax=Glycomyces buryatensis TaxID=2570927 RepID=A0A4S8QJ57_9ACTN|nr:hypothetical protein [Glycomyces buryatensis]THV41399.1 hypothetical protein FAB82_11400 [Glycomyces buryatensis]
MRDLENVPLEELKQTFERVTCALEAAAIPWVNDADRLPDHAAAIVALDDMPGDRGVFVFWLPGRNERCVAVEAFEGGDWDNPEIDDVGTKTEHGMETIAAALSAAGILTRDTDDPMNPFTLEVMQED